MLRILKLLLAVPLVLIMVVIVVINARLGYKPGLHKELSGLKNAIAQNADIEMQSIYPEGYVFLNSLYALSWSSFIQEHKEYANEGLVEIQRSLNKINSPTGRQPFSENLELKYGTFYNGWSSYVLASKLKVHAPDIRTSEDTLAFKQQCDMIAAAVQRSIYPPTYDGSSWPADATICVASLAAHDQLFTPKYTGLIRSWVTNVQSSLDTLGMIPHSAQSNGSVNEAARGSSMALMLIFLHNIDQTFARQQFDLFKQHFLDHKLGLTGIREYPKGISGTGDIDSGPVILGFGGAATIVGMQTLSLFGEHDAATRIRNGVEALGFTNQTDDSKQYFFGVLPIADAFIAWSHAGMQEYEQKVWFVEFRIYSILFFTIISVLFWRLVWKEIKT